MHVKSLCNHIKGGPAKVRPTLYLLTDMFLIASLMILLYLCCYPSVLVMQLPCFYC